MITLKISVAVLYYFFSQHFLDGIMLMTEIMQIRHGLKKKHLKILTKHITK